MTVTCARCGSTERRPGGKGCLPCHGRDSGRQWQRKRAALLAEPDDDIVITPAVRRYLAAFDGYLHARRAGDAAGMRAGEYARHVALGDLLGGD